MFKRGSVTRNRPYPPPEIKVAESLPLEQRTPPMDIPHLLTEDRSAPTPPVIARRWKGLVIPVKEYAVIKATDPVTKKNYYHVMVNPFQKDRILSIAEELLTAFDKDKTGRHLRPIPVTPSMYGIQTQDNEDWYLFMYVSPKTVEELKSCKDNDVYLRCVYWENADSLYKNGVSLTGMRTASPMGQDLSNETPPLEGWTVEIV